MTQRPLRTARGPDTADNADNADTGQPIDLDDAFAPTDADRGLRILGTLKLLVGGQDSAPRTRRRGDAPASRPDGTEDLPLANTISGVIQDRAARPRRRRREWPPGTGLPIARFSTAEARPNMLVHGEDVTEVPLQLLRWWAPGHHDCVVIDIDGRYPQIDLSDLGAEHADVAHTSPDQLRELLRARRGVTVLDFSHLPAGLLSTALGRVLSVIAISRARTGHPDWLMIDSTERVLNDPDIPPNALDLSQRGHCLVMRSAHGLLESLTASIDIVVGSSDLSAGRVSPDLAAPPRPR